MWIHKMAEVIGFIVMCAGVGAGVMWVIIWVDWNWVMGHRKDKS
jgi:hypothetical protein